MRERITTRLKTWWEDLSQPEIPHGIREDLKRVVGILTNPENPPPRLITLFGSLNTGEWNRRRSDIDLGVILDTEDPQYSAYTNSVIKHVIDPESYGEIPVFSETPERKQLRAQIFNNPELELGLRYELHILTPSDLERLRAGEIFPYIDPFKVRKMRLDKFAHSLETGRVLYKK